MIELYVHLSAFSVVSPLQRRSLQTVSTVSGIAFKSRSAYGSRRMDLKEAAATPCGCVQFVFKYYGSEDTLGSRHMESAAAVFGKVQTLRTTIRVSVFRNMTLQERGRRYWQDYIPQFCTSATLREPRRWGKGHALLMGMIPL
jgi:hypothetical protein